MILGIDGAPFVAGIPRFEELPEFAFAICRVSFGATPDRAAEEYVRRARWASKIVHGYAYLRTWEPIGPQVDLALSLRESLRLPFLWVDCEPVLRRDGSMVHDSDRPEIARLRLIEWVARARERGAPIGVYGGADYLARLSLPEDFAALPLWVAHYGVSKPRIPRPWKEYTIWQSKGDIDRAGARIDINESPLTLEQFAAMGAPLPYDLLAPILNATRAAEGRGAGSVGDFVTTPEIGDL